jgi:hypothetical protein
VEAFGNESSLVTINGAISFVFNVKNSFAANYVHVGGGNKGPSVVAKSGIIFSVHSIMPSKVLCSCRVRGRFDVIGAKGNKKSRRQRIVDETLEQDLGLEDVILRLGLHAM